MFRSHHFRIVCIAMLVIASAFAGLASAEDLYDCNDIAPSAGPVPAALVAQCGSGLQASPTARLTTDSFVGVETQTANFYRGTNDTPDVMAPIGAVANIASFPGAGDFDTTAENFYYANNAGEFYQVPVATGVPALVNTFANPSGTTSSGMAWDDVQGLFYLVTTNLTTSILSTLDTSGNITTVGPLSHLCVIALGINNAGDLYGYDICTDELISIDPAGPSSSSIGPLGFDANFGQGMDFDPSDDTCYLYAFNGTSFAAELRTCDTGTGATNLVGVLGATSPGGLLQVSAGGVEVPIAPPVPTVEIPTLQPFGVGLLAVGLAFATVFVLRRRRAN